MVKQKRRLLFGALDRHEAHRRSPHSLANRFRIGGVVLLALHVRLYKRHQSNIMPVCGELSSPVVWQASMLTMAGSIAGNHRNTSERHSFRL
jgi:hypothetical protein